MAYADYKFYTKTFLGNVIAADDFPRLALRASERIDEMTYGRAAAHFVPAPEIGDDLTAIQMAIAKATCALAEAIGQTEMGSGADGAPVRQERMHNYSVTYSQRTEAEIRAKENAAAAVYLAQTGLLYAGVGHRG